MECIECMYAPTCNRSHDGAECINFKYFLEDMNSGEVVVSERKPTITEKVEKKSSVKEVKGKGLFE